MKWDFNNLAYGPDESQKLSLNIPQKQEVHAIVYIHGGAYLFGTKAQYPMFLEDYAKDNIVATIDYRLIEKDNDIKMTDMLSDVHEALKKITELSGTYNVTIKDFILAGHSAGGHIALLYGYKHFQKNEELKIAACISLAGPTDFTDDLGWSKMTTWGGDLRSRLSFMSDMGTRLTGYEIELTQGFWTKQKNYSSFKEYITDISPVMYVNKMEKIPPTLLVHARADNQVPYSNAVRLNTALDNTSVPHQLITATGGADNHMLGRAVFADTAPPFLYEDQIWVAEAKKWIEKYLS